MRHLVTDVALLTYIAKKNADVISYSEAAKACKSSSSASRALHQLIKEGLIEPKPKLLGLRYVTQYEVTQRGKRVAELALQLTELRERAMSNKEVSDLKKKATAKKTERNTNIMKTFQKKGSPVSEEQRITAQAP